MIFTDKRFPKFHGSLLTCLGELRKRIDQFTNELNQKRVQVKSGIYTTVGTYISLSLF
jgi:Sec-independent protein translocase protein TatA